MLRRSNKNKKEIKLTQENWEDFISPDSPIEMFEQLKTFKNKDEVLYIFIDVYEYKTGDYKKVKELLKSLLRGITVYDYDLLKNVIKKVKYEDYPIEFLELFLQNGFSGDIYKPWNFAITIYQNENDENIKKILEKYGVSKDNVLGTNKLFEMVYNNKIEYIEDYILENGKEKLEKFKDIKGHNLAHYAKSKEMLEILDLPLIKYDMYKNVKNVLYLGMGIDVYNMMDMFYTKSLRNIYVIDLFDDAYGDTKECQMQIISSMFEIFGLSDNILDRKTHWEATFESNLFGTEINFYHYEQSFYDVWPKEIKNIDVIIGIGAFENTKTPIKIKMFTERTNKKFMYVTNINNLIIGDIYLKNKWNPHNEYSISLLDKSDPKWVDYVLPF